MAETTIIDYEQMQNISRSLVEESRSIADLLENTRSKVNDLHINGWIGEGSKSFYAEMENRILPSFQRLVEALEFASNTAVNIVRLFKSSEEEAAGSIKSVTDSGDSSTGMLGGNTASESLQGVGGTGGVHPSSPGAMGENSPDGKSSSGDVNEASPQTSNQSIPDYVYGGSDDTRGPADGNASNAASANYETNGASPEQSTPDAPPIIGVTGLVGGATAAAAAGINKVSKDRNNDRDEA